ncbi:competence protein ComEA helix-hairpin-helix repeat protein [Clostridium sp. CAG:465]|nr:competence protein ComEA helix-hairpin-helix repeat protein [Clostridium sp. CAG:465]
MSKIIKFILKYKIQIVFICIFIISGISIYIQDNERKASFSVNSSNISKNDDRIGVYISGEVKNTGVYYLKKDSRITDLINICGGITEEADVSKINPAQKLNDSDKIIIPKKEENLNTESIEDTNESDINVQEKININTATKDELTSLNGIGEATANKIINYRNKNKFKEIEDIMNVPGIGEAKFNNIKDYICV